MLQLRRRNRQEPMLKPMRSVKRPRVKKPHRQRPYDHFCQAHRQFLPANLRNGVAHSATASLLTASLLSLLGH